MAKKVPIDWPDIARQSGKSGKLHLFRSSTFNSWVVENGQDPHIAIIEAPKGAIRIEKGFWVIEECFGEPTQESDECNSCEILDKCVDEMYDGDKK